MNVLLFLWTTGSMKSQSSGLLGLLYGLVFVAVLLFWGRATNFVCSCKAWPPSSLDRIPDMSKKTSFKNCSITPVFIFFLTLFSSSPSVLFLLPPHSFMCICKGFWDLQRREPVTLVFMCLACFAYYDISGCVPHCLQWNKTALSVCVCVCVCHTFFIPLLTATSADSVTCLLGLGLKQTSIFILQY